MIQDRTISLGCAAATALWSVTVMLILAGAICAFTVVEGGTGMATTLTLMSSGLSASAAAATVTIRNMIHAQNKRLESAFNLGQEAGRLRQVAP